MLEIRTEREIRRARRLDLAVNGYRDGSTLARVTFRKPEEVTR